MLSFRRHPLGRSIRLSRGGRRASPPRARPCGGRTARRCGRPELREAVLLGPAGGPDPGNNEATTPPPAVCGGRRPSWVRYRTDRHAMRTAVGSCRLRWPLPGCGPEGRGFESPRSPQASRASAVAGGHGKETSPIYADRAPGRVPSRRTRSPLAAPIPTTPNRWPPGPGTRAVPLVGCGHPVPNCVRVTPRSTNRRWAPRSMSSDQVTPRVPARQRRSCLGRQRSTRPQCPRIWGVGARRRGRSTDRRGAGGRGCRHARRR